MAHGPFTRTTLPALLACGLALLLVRPIDVADPAAASDVPLPTPRVARTLGTAVPAVAFTDRVHVVDGRIRTQVRVDGAAPAGTAGVVGAGCAVAAPPGVVTWLSCPYAGQRTVTVAVTLSDGRRFTHTVVPADG
jgi:hypothetical protein